MYFLKEIRSETFPLQNSKKKFVLKKPSTGV